MMKVYEQYRLSEENGKKEKKSFFWFYRVYI